MYCVLFRYINLLNLFSKNKSIHLKSSVEIFAVDLEITTFSFNLASQLILIFLPVFILEFVLRGLIRNMGEKWFTN